MYHFPIISEKISILVALVTTCSKNLLFAQCKWLAHPIGQSHRRRMVVSSRCLWKYTATSTCLGAADGKHVRIIHPRNSGSTFYNYKSYYSIMLMAAVDANYKFIFADVGCQGKISNSGVMRNTQFRSKLVNGHLNLPKASSLFVFHFSVRHIFNCRLFWGRRVSENAFGILPKWFRMYSTVLSIKSNNAVKVVLCNLGTW